MPELPEVETMRRGILGIAGSTVKRAVLERCDCRPIAVFPAVNDLQRRVRGRRVEAVERLGKRIVLRLSSGDSLIFEPRMTGLLLLADPPDVEHLRFRLDFADGSVPSVWFWDRRGLGTIRLFSSVEREQLAATSLGPDALEVTVERLRTALGGSRRAVKVALLDQRALAGVGNLYASEILHRAGIHPERRCDALTVKHWTRIHVVMREVLEEAIRYEGSTLSDGTYRNALNQSGGYQNEHRVYDREGDACKTCGRGTVVRIVQAQRSTFYCGRCQRLR